MTGHRVEAANPGAERVFFQHNNIILTGAPSGMPAMLILAQRDGVRMPVVLPPGPALVNLSVRPGPPR